MVLLGCFIAVHPFASLIFQTATSPSLILHTVFSPSLGGGACFQGAEQVAIRHWAKNPIATTEVEGGIESEDQSTIYKLEELYKVPAGPHPQEQTGH